MFTKCANALNSNVTNITSNYEELETQVADNTSGIIGLSIQISDIGQYYYASPSATVSVANEVYITIASINLPSAGLYIISGGFAWSSAFGQLAIGSISYKSNNTIIEGTTVRHTGSNGGGYSATAIMRTTQPEPVQLRAYQSSGSTKAANAIRLTAALIK